LIKTLFLPETLLVDVNLGSFYESWNNILAIVPALCYNNSVLEVVWAVVWGDFVLKKKQPP
jgi:hypothetical protein